MSRMAVLGERVRQKLRKRLYESLLLQVSSPPWNS